MTNYNTIIQLVGYPVFLANLDHPFEQNHQYLINLNP
jgi:hypothetical protein